MQTTTLDLGPQTAEVARIVAGVRDDQLDRRTPCTDLTVAGLLDHLVGPTLAFRGAADEVLVHGWDVAVATGQDHRADPASAQACLDLGIEPAASAPEMRDQMYAPVVPVPDAPVLDRLRGQAGRDPRWS